MDEENKMQEAQVEQTADTATATDNGTNVEENNKQSFTQEQVNDIVRQRLERQTSKFYGRYGVKGKDELDVLVGKANSYDIMKERYEGMEATNKQLSEKLIFIENNINPERYEDVKAYFKGKELELNAENLGKELSMHNEWLNVVKEESSPTTTIKSLGIDREVKQPLETDDEKMVRIFGKFN